MSVQSVERAGSSGVEAGWADEIDLGRWARAVGRRWPVLLAIILLTIVAALAGRWLLGRMGEPVYEAGADVAIVRLTSELTFDERFTTTANDVPATNIAARRSALLGLAGSPALAVATIQELGDVLPVEERDPAKLASTVQTNLVTGNGRPGDSDLIRISATASTPDKAAAIASAWARAFVQQANRVYGQVPDEMIASIQEERANAEQAYNSAQSELQSFVAAARTDEVFRQVTGTEAAINSLYQARRDALDSMLGSMVEAQEQSASAVLNAVAENRSAAYVQEQEGRRQLVLEYLDAIYTGQSEVFRQRAQQDIQLLQDAYTRRLQTVRALDGARTLRDQVAAVETGQGAGEISGGSALVLDYLKLQALTQLTDPAAPPQQQVAPAPSVTVQGELPPRAQGQQQAQTLAPTVVENTQPVQVYAASSPVQVQLDARAAVDKATLLAELDALIGTLEMRSAELEQQITAQSTLLLDPNRYGDVSEATLGNGQLTAAVQEQYTALMAQGILTPSLSLQGLAAIPGMGGAGGATANSEEELAALTGAADDAAFQGAMAPLEARLRSLKAEHEALRARNVQLTQGRDLALDAYKTVNSKVAELTVARAAASSEVRFAAPAVAPANPLPGLSLLLVLALGAVLGLLLAAFYLVVSELRAGSPKEQRA